MKGEDRLSHTLETLGRKDAVTLTLVSVMLVTSHVGFCDGIMKRGGRPWWGVQCHGHPSFPLCKHSCWVAPLKNTVDHDYWKFQNISDQTYENRYYT